MQFSYCRVGPIYYRTLNQSKQRLSVWHVGQDCSPRLIKEIKEISLQTHGPVQPLYLEANPDICHGPHSGCFFRREQTGQIRKQERGTQFFFGAI